MFIQSQLRDGAIAYDYTTKSTEVFSHENQDSFENQYITLTVPVYRLLWLAKKWNCPKNAANRQVLSEENWEKERKALIAYDKNLKVIQKAALCGTYHKFGVSYLIWLEFTGPDAIMHKLDVYINETSGSGEIYAIKTIDGVKCDYVYDSIIKTGFIPVIIAKKLNSIGSITWTGSAEVKSQFKLNSWNQQQILETVASTCPFVTLIQLDPYDDCLYKGDPGCLADYDLMITLKDGRTVTTRLDLKLLLDLAKVSEQNPHDAELLIASSLLTSDIHGCRVSDFTREVKIEETDEFKEFMLLFKAALKNNPRKYIKIHNIDTNTGKVTYDYFN